MIRRAAVMAIALSACQTTTDPADGGFFAGVAGITSGAYDSRLAAAEADVEARRIEQRQLQDRIAAAEAELASLKLRIANQRASLRTSPPELTRSIDSVLLAPDPEGDGAERLRALRKAISDARALSADLVRLAG
mgnify:CR=1 FL=1